MKFLICFMLVLPSIFSFLTKSKIPIQIMSFNLRYDNPNDGWEAWPNRRDFVVSLIRKYDPDLLGIQEALPLMVDYLKSNLKDYEYWGRGREAEGGGEASGVFYRKNLWKIIDQGHFWLSETPYEPGSILQNITLPRMVSWIRMIKDRENEDYYYFNTHFAYEDEEIRFREAQILIEQIKNITNTFDLTSMKRFILSGDYNAMPFEKAINLITEQKVTDLQDTINAITLEPNVDYGTFHAFTGLANGTRIDYVFSSKDFELVDYQIIKVVRKDGLFPSDHFPIIAKIK